MTKFKINYRVLLCSSLPLLMAMPSLLAQKKYEREYSLKRTAVPAPAVSFVDDVFGGAKVNWYGEESLNGTTVEAKLKSGGKRYSVEFTTNGTLLDVEILTSFSGIPGVVRKIITQEMKVQFSSYRVIKTQVQWTAPAALMKMAIVSEILPAGVVVRYELVVKGRKTGLQKYYEVLCDAEGAISSIHEIVQRNADNLMY